MKQTIVHHKVAGAAASAGHHAPEIRARVKPAGIVKLGVDVHSRF